MLEQQNIEESQNMKYKDIIKTISKMSGIGQKQWNVHWQKTKQKVQFHSQIKKKIRKTVIEKTDDFDKNAIRRKVHSFLINHEIPTLKIIVVAVNKDEHLPNFKTP